MDAELEYHLLGLKKELEDVEEEAERAMVRHATLLVRSKRSERYVNRTSNPQEMREKLVRPTCPLCSKKLRYIPQYARWYCDFCRKYAPRDVERKIEEASENTLMKWYEQVWKRPSETSTDEL